MAKDTYTVERSVTIDAPLERIYEQLADFHNWVNWSPWEDLDPDIKRTYSGAEVGTGSVYVWSGNRKAGQGRMQITEASEPSKVLVEVAFEKPFKGENDITLTVLQDGPQARVTWVMTGKNSAITKMMGVFKSMDKVIGPDFERGLARLKAFTEKA
ncbi:MAG: hypothetical protein QOE58_104 [Actinomycetota bacterium]|jgi:uncharacterized protein YndB with AHSA1/START domain|nr:hypothetical protein [Actinomycetota bacterium]